MDHGGRALTGLIAEHGPGDALLDHQRGRRTGEAAHGSRAGESTAEDQRQSIRQIADVDDDHAKSRRQEQNDQGTILPANSTTRLPPPQTMTHTTRL